MDSLQDFGQEGNVNIRELLTKYAVYWPWFLISVAGALCIAFFINHFSAPVYQVQTSILVEDEKKMLDEKFTSGLGMYNNSYKLPNEIEILKSYSLVSKTIKRLNFNVAYFESGKFSDAELYKHSPFLLIPDSTLVFPLFTSIYIDILSSTTYTVHVQSKEEVPIIDLKTGEIKTQHKNLSIDATGNFFKPFLEKNLGFILTPNGRTNLNSCIGKHYCFMVFDNNSLIGQFRNLNIFAVKSSSVLNISLQGNNVLKLVDFLNTFTQVYLERGLEKKYRMAENTIRFINNQLNEVGDSLFFSEQLLQDYRSDNHIVDISFQAQQVFTQLESLKTERADIVLKNKYYEYLQQFLKEDNDGKNLIVPSSLGIQDQTINTMINGLIDLYIERAEITVNSKRDNPLLSSNQQRIKNLKESVLQNINTMIKTSKMSLQDIDHRIEEISGNGNKLPEKQRKLISFERKFKLNDALYTYLLTKRSETQIAKASYTSDNEVIDAASAQEYRQVSPKTQHNYLIAFILGLGIPAILLFLKNYFNNKILNVEDIDAITSYPILGHIIHSREKTYTVVNDFPMSQTAESIRAIRTNFQFVAREQESNIILVTSTMMNEGKSFSVVNLALSFALIKKKTIILNFDLRRPKLQEYLDIHSDKGLSVYLSGNAELGEVIVHTRFENLDAILAGPIPPNPMELIASENTSKLFQILKQTYDYIIVDTAPIGMVADGLLLVKYSNVNIFVVRYNNTHKKALLQLMQNLKKRDIQNVNIVLNDLHLHRSMGYGYNYNYGYGYSYGNPSTSKFKKFFSLLKLTRNSPRNP
jgi:capsular exopolysaccharide synthesis family protein